MHTFTINTVSFRHVSALEGPSSRSMTDTFQQQDQPNELPDPKFSLVISVQYITRRLLQSCSDSPLFVKLNCWNGTKNHQVLVLIYRSLSFCLSFLLSFLSSFTLISFPSSSVTTINLPLFLADDTNCNMGLPPLPTRYSCTVRTLHAHSQPRPSHVLYIYICLFVCVCVCVA